MLNRVPPQKTETPEASPNHNGGQFVPPFLNQTQSPYMTEAANSAQSKNILSSDVEIKGLVKFKTDLFVDGTIEGEIVSPGILIVGEHAQIRGEIKTKSITVHGQVTANVTVQERCELKGEAQLIGDLKAARLVIEEGTTFVGKSEVSPSHVAMKLPEIVRAPEMEKRASGGR